jgi:hypothetical protein
VEFVIFVRSKKLPQWFPLSIMKGGSAANLLVKTLQNDIGKKLYGNQLIDNVARAMYQGRAENEAAIRAQLPMFKDTKEFEYAFKIRDKENPKTWYQITDDMVVLPAEADIEATPVEKVSSFFSDIGKGLGITK